MKRRSLLATSNSPRPALRRVGVSTAFVLLSAGASFVALGEAPKPGIPPHGSDAELISHGKYVADAGDCAGCHTAPMGGKAFAGGLGLASPFGTIISSNITPDPRFGIGRYSFRDFERAVRQGIAPGDKQLYPAMPYPSYTKMSDDDLRALYAYMLRGVKPVAEPAPATKIPFPFNQRWILRYWKGLFTSEGRYQRHSAHDAEWNRGAYLVQSLGHCGSCHTPRGVGFQEKGYDESSAAFLAGTVNDNWFAANLTGEPTAGLGRVDNVEIVSFLKTGHGGGLVAFGSMVAQVEDSTQYLNDTDLKAIAVYLKTLVPQRPSGHYAPNGGSTTAGVSAGRIADEQSLGAAVYTSFCAACHQANGTGVPGRYPRLAGNPVVLGEDTTSLIRLMVEADVSPYTLTGPPIEEMLDFAGKLSSLQIAQVLSYIRSAWGNDTRDVTTNDVVQL